ncbi:FAD-dependent oxidoreductase [Rathayibacter sp. VKM Ac-2760]|uniref:NAD(P)/FAD-dependent oxidoreductase n=1 Tax=Rathayibacter sp. VKM Ac-2760 TaxID=2609253 RepID=UPI001317DAD3|nr:FAD-dependent oxidoreductase [Rathayibacter sp. VKM Ac-2760]QHC61064.1 FAD-dependent oxidoreductase [Rathayibacter sp. VKM Ac-2760]
MSNPAARGTPLEQSVLIVGASASGLATAEALRRAGHHGALTLLDAEAHPPYDRPPLSKQLLAGDWDRERVELRPAEALADLDADFLLGHRAVRLDLDDRSVTTDDGRRLSADAVVIATGVTPRRLPGQDQLTGTHVLRSLDDALRLKDSLDPGRRLVVIGNGVLGSEIAATAGRLGVTVTLVGTDPLPVQRRLGRLGAWQLTTLHQQAGVALRSGSRVARLLGDDGDVRGVELDTGETLPADDVVVAIGSDPQTGWLEQSGLRVDDGVVCDAGCSAAPGVWAVGDVARWEHPFLGSQRFENRTNAAEQALAVAQNVLGGEIDYAPIPYFWTDQHGVKIMVHGAIPADARTVITDGDPAAGRFVAMAVSAQDGDPVGVLGWGMPKQTRLRRAELVAARERVDATPDAPRRTTPDASRVRFSPA